MTSHERLEYLVLTHSPGGLANLPEAIVIVGVPRLLKFYEAIEAWNVALKELQQAAAMFEATHGTGSTAIH